jgi:membrane fusion protein, heavy metal efflux system
MTMQTQLPTTVRSSSISWRRWMTVSIIALAIVAAAGFLAQRWARDHSLSSADEQVPAGDSGRRDAADTVRLPQAKWAGAGIQIEPMTPAPFTDRVWRTGRLELNESRLAHLFPVAEGIIRDVQVRLGQDVQQGDILAVLNSREVGEAKLNLVRTRLASDYAKAQHEWTQMANRNARELVEAMLAETPISQIEEQFKDRVIGDLRQQLMTSFSRRLQMKAHFESAQKVGSRNAMPESTFIRIKADYEAADATYRALCEEIKFQTLQEVRISGQKLQESKTSDALAKAQLMMLGYVPEEVAAMDPVAEGPKVSHCAVRAPFGGTIVAMHAVLAERVGPQIQLFEIADLSTLWLQADVFEQDLATVHGLKGTSLNFRVGGELGSLYQAQVFYTGDVVGKETRAATLRAEVPNPQRNLKPGMFVEVEFAHQSDQVIQVPPEAVQRDGTQPFVFVHVGGDEFRRANVTLGRSSENRVELLRGIKPGERVVVAGGFILKSELLKEQLAGD